MEPIILVLFIMMAGPIIAGIGTAIYLCVKNAPPPGSETQTAKGRLPYAARYVPDIASPIPGANMDTDKIADLCNKLDEVHQHLGDAVECRSEPVTSHIFLREAYEQVTEVAAELKRLTYPQAEPDVSHTAAADRRIAPPR